MPVAKKVVTPHAVKKITASTARVTRVPADLTAFTLPSAASTPKVGFSDLTWLIYGEKGIGKTSTAARFPQALLIPFEPGTKFLTIARLPIVRRWEEFLHVVKQLEAGGAEYRTVVIDPGNKAYDTCMNFVCTREGVTHPSDRKDFGKTWGQVSKEFQEAHARLAGAGVSMVILAHQKMLEVETYSGQSFSRIVPVMSSATEEYYAGIVDMIGYYHYHRAKRYLQIRGDDFVMAKCRPEQHFITRDGEPVVRIPMGRSSAEGYNNIIAAFENQQRETFADLGGQEAPSTGTDAAPLSRKAYKRPAKGRE